LAKKLDALIEMLDVTADALAAMWDQASGERAFDTGEDFQVPGGCSGAAF
jgi:hypothetical protein